MGPRLKTRRYRENTEAARRIVQQALQASAERPIMQGGAGDASDVAVFIVEALERAGFKLRRTFESVVPGGRS